MTTLYRFFDDTSRLLYIGVAGNPGRRFNQHEKERAWWPSVAHTTTVHFSTRAEALDAEKRAIQDEQPLHNIVHSGRASTTKAPKRPFVMVFLDGLNPTLDRQLSNFEARLLDFLIRRMNDKNEVRLSQGEIARALGKHPPDISKALRTLRTNEYLTTPQQGVVLISPDVAWHAALDDNADALQNWSREG